MQMLGSKRISKKKLNGLLLSSISETANLIKMHQEHQTIAEADVVHLLQTSQTRRALLWVERVMKEQNMLDVLLIVQMSLQLLSEKVVQIQIHRLCPNELREVVASLIFAAPRCGECPQLRKLSLRLQSWFLKHSFATATEANQQMVDLLSTKQPSLDSRLQALHLIAKDNGITLNPNNILLSEFD
ncbi:uncharacterized protein LOC120278669 [Dioscorea cayenensis subsp. rotundata]|uniref:Uncharacterized protein LOC120278669 n=1 Tax=Dioscorea cayennensis subsp. rotundata TaxID=55577 RepID=A0AB40CTD4_DIOCR|nr:uncharacterized protein LOC120278669 [Dioscorea cayenensis subsp. rotundata]